MLTKGLFAQSLPQRNTKKEVERYGTDKRSYDRRFYLEKASLVLDPLTAGKSVPAIIQYGGLRYCGELHRG